MAPSTAAAPHMSNFMNSIFSAGLMEMPPVSKQSPFPTRTIGASPFFPWRYSIATRRGSCGVPCATDRNEPIPSFSISSRPSTVMPIRWRLAISCAVSERYSGVHRLPGIIARRRVISYPAPSAFAAAKPPRLAAEFAATMVAAVRGARRSSGEGGVRSSLYSHAPRCSPTPIASTPAASARGVQAVIRPTPSFIA